MKTYTNMTYEMIGENQIQLTEEEEIKLVYEYKQAKYMLHKYILGKKKCIRWFCTKYRVTLKEGKSVAKLSADYNPREQGKNRKIEKDFYSSLLNFSSDKSFYKPYDVVIFDLNPSNECYNEMLKLIKPTATLRGIQEKMSTLENTLLCSMLMAGQEIAKNNASAILSIDEADAAQEVNLYLLDSIRKYDPDYRTPQGKRVKLCTYAYGRAENLLKEWVLTNSRLVRVPRSKMERILIIVKAHDILAHDQINLFTLTIKANTILRDRKGELKANNIFTIEEVDDLIKILMSNYIHIDQPFHRHNKSSQITIGDMLSTQEESIENKIEDKQTREKLFDLIRKELNPLEFQVITLRYFDETADKVPRALADVGTLLMSTYGEREYSRETIRLIEKAAIVKLKDVKEVQELW